MRRIFTFSSRLPASSCFCAALSSEIGIRARSENSESNALRILLIEHVLFQTTASHFLGTCSFVTGPWLSSPYALPFGGSLFCPWSASHERGPLSDGIRWG